MNPIPPPVQTVLDLFETHLADVRFGDVDAQTLARLATVQSTTAQNTPAGSAQQTEPPAPGTGTLSVITNPAGAQVSVDEVPWGASPATIPNLAAGAHNLRLEKAGYQNLSVPVAITDGKTAEYSLALVPESGGMGMLPLIAGAFIVIALAGIGGFLYMQKKKALPPAEPPK